MSPHPLHDRQTASMEAALPSGSHLIVCPGPGCHFHSVNHLLHVDHFKDREGVPNDDPDIPNDSEIDVMPCVGGDSSKYTCSAGCQSEGVLAGAGTLSLLC